MSPSPKIAASDSLNEIATVRVELRDTDPLIWREVEVPTSITLKVLHDIIQAVMGWFDYHLWEFTIGKQRYGLPMDEDWGTAPRKDAAKVRLRDVLKPRRTTIDYLYDFGDSWEHVVKIEDLVAPRPSLPPVVCLAGANACPPEDVGGPPGYAEFLAILADPAHEEHADMLRWAGGSFDPTAFDPEATNALLKTIKF